MTDGLLAGRVAIVTGGGGGIGRGVSERFAAEGAQVLVAEIDPERAAATATAISAAGGIARAVIADVREPSEVDRVVASTLDAFGSVDVLVNNVGHYGGARRPFHEQDRDEWNDLYRVNLEHAFLCSKAVLPTMVEHHRGAIVNVSTIEAFRGIPSRAAYAAFKAGVTGFTKSLALEYAQHGIRVNAIAPDVTETPQVPYSRWVKPEDEHLVPVWVPIGRFGTPDDLAGVALFLASDLSAFVTGTTVHADGGTFAAGGWFRTEEGGWTNRPRRP
ncbi:MAG: SDR family oxidoreductase [Acidimicrobiia bacterium]|nr:SDR family oxidoreductase [Acidimicrobiia bacterium]